MKEQNMYKPMTKEREDKFRNALLHYFEDVYPIVYKDGIIFINTMTYVEYVGYIKRPPAEVMEKFFKHNPKASVKDCLSWMEDICTERSHIVGKNETERTELVDLMAKTLTDIRTNPVKLNFVKEMVQKYPREKYPDMYY